MARNTVQRWIQRYRRRGVTGSLTQEPYQGKKPRLSLEQIRELDILIRQGPQKSGLGTGVWTSPIIADLVRWRFGIAYSPSQIRRILEESGFLLQYPRQELSKAYKKREATWLEVELLR